MDERRVRISKHAAQRLAQRFGWVGCKEAAGERLMQFPSIAAAVAVSYSTQRRWVVNLPTLDMRLHGVGALVTTVLLISEIGAYKARKRNVKGRREKTFLRTGSRPKRSPRPTPREAQMEMED